MLLLVKNGKLFNKIITLQDAVYASWPTAVHVDVTGRSYFKLTCNLNIITTAKTKNIPYKHFNVQSFSAVRVPRKRDRHSLYRFPLVFWEELFSSFPLLLFLFTASQLLRIFGRCKAASTFTENQNRKCIGPTVSAFTRSQSIFTQHYIRKKVSIFNHREWNSVA